MPPTRSFCTLVACLGVLAPLSSLLGGCSVFTNLDALGNASGGSGLSGATGGTAGTSGSGATTGTGAAGGAGSGGSTTGTTLTGGGGTSTSNEVVLVDEQLEGQFGLGTFQQTQWSQMGGVVLQDGDGNGVFTSRVLDAGAPLQWLTLEWNAAAPYGEALPDNGAAEVGFEPGTTVDMTDNVLLWHLDSPVAIPSGGTLPDASGHNHPAIVVAGQGALQFGSGQFDTAMDDSGSTYAYVNAGGDADLTFGTADFTWSIWVKTGQSCENNRVHLGLDDGPGDTPHLWLGCMSPGSKGCPQQFFGGWAGGTFTDRHQSGEAAYLCGTTFINDGEWHHLAIVKKNHTPATLSLFVDGNIESTAIVNFALPIQYITKAPLTVGAFSDGTYQSQGKLDEVAIWRRALTNAEIESLHVRGILRLSFQARSCSLPTCADSPPFAGSGQSKDSFFTGLLPPSDASVVHPITEFPINPFFQYEATFSSQNKPETPRLKRVEIKGQPANP